MKHVSCYNALQSQLTVRLQHLNTFPITLSQHDEKPPLQLDSVSLHCSLLLLAVSLCVTSCILSQYLVRACLLLCAICMPELY